MWGMHTTDNALFTNENIVAIGWREMGDIGKLEDNREVFKERYSETYHDDLKKRIAINAGQLYRFVYGMGVGDYVIYTSKNTREIFIGVVEGDYCYNPSAPEYVHQRKIKWVKQLPRTSFSQGALYEIGSAMTLFAVKNYADEFLAALEGKTRPVIDEEDETVAATADEIIESTKDFILKELSKHLKGYDLELFVADLLDAMGYRTTVSSHGGDSGIDITAYKDELPPRILVQIKSQDGDIKEATLQSLKGAMREGDYGLFVTLSRYTKNAQKYLDGVPIIRGIDGSDLVELILKYYDKLNEKYQKLIPLKMVYIPATAADERTI
jgi:restriction system protein